MQARPRFIWFRQTLFPYNGEEVLSSAQCRRVVISWSLFFASTLTLATLPVMLVFGMNSLSQAGIFLALTFCGCAILFGLMAFFVVYMTNQSALIQQQWKQQ